MTMVIFATCIAIPVYADPMSGYTIVDSDKYPDDDKIIVYYCDKDGEGNDAALFISKDGGATKQLVREFKHTKESEANNGLVKFTKFDEEKNNYPLLIVLKDEESYAQNGEGMGVYRSDDFGETITCIGFKGDKVEKISMGQDLAFILAYIDSQRNATTGVLEKTNDLVFSSYDNGLTWSNTREIQNTDDATSDQTSAKIPASEYEHLTHTKYNKYVDRYHLTLVETIEENKKGGEGFQCMNSQEMCDYNANYAARGYDSCGIYYTKDGAKTWYHEEKNKEAAYSAGVSDLEYHPENPEILYSYRDAITNGSDTVSGLYLSEDGGMTSRRIYTFSHTKEARCRDGLMKFGPKDEKTGVYPLYLVIKDEVAFDKGMDTGKLGLFVSYDYGYTFECIGFEGKKIANITMSHDKDFIVVTVEKEKDSSTGQWVDAKDNVYVGYIAGNTGSITWEKRTKGIETYTAATVGIDTQNKEHWITSPYLVYDNEGYPVLYETFDSGNNWEELIVETWNAPHETGKNRNITKRSGYAREIKFTWPDENGKTALLINMSPSTWPYRISHDGGKTFKYINEDGKHLVGKDETGWFSDCIALSKAAPNVILTSVWKSEDYGELFYWNDSSVSGQLAFDYIFGPDGQVKIIAGFDVGIFKTDQRYEGDYLR